MAQITYREALNQALREELDRDERVFIMGEEVGYFGGAFKVTDGLLAVYGEKRVRDTPISELTIRRRRYRRRDGWAEADSRADDYQLRTTGYGSNSQ